jgi:UDP-N-acetylglucosamine--N-acetylmuramyl-(pentapeptide) pyrophosphoryl-undecaprenol N-acetylglucosamine transferase
LLEEPSTPAAQARKLRICLAGSGGGHLRQLLDLEPVWREYDHFFVTEQSALGESVAKDHRARFVQHYSFGQVRWGQPIKMLAAMARNLVQSIRILAKERPDVILTTGAGAVFWTALLGRLTGARLILVESFARFRGPSKFGLMVKPFATDLIVQSPQLKRRWPAALIFDPFRMLEGPRPAKQPLMLVTVGATLPFERLIEGMKELVDRGEVPEQVVLQTGRGSRFAQGEDGRSRTVATLDFEDLKRILRDADIVVTHGGTGSLITALREGCRVVAMPRRFEHKELYDDHQIEIITAFAERGLIEVALEPSQLGAAIERARRKVPPMATTDPSELLGWLEARLAAIARQRA